MVVGNCNQNLSSPNFQFAQITRNPTPENQPKQLKMPLTVIGCRIGKCILDAAKELAMF